MKRKKNRQLYLICHTSADIDTYIIRNAAGRHERRKRQFTVLLPLGDLAYDEDFFAESEEDKRYKRNLASHRSPVVIKIEDYTETTTFSGIDMNAFGKNPTQNELGKMPLLLLEMVPYGI